jgi:hypothetical protein
MEIGKRKQASFRLTPKMINDIAIYQDQENQKRTAKEGILTKDQIAERAFKLLFKSAKK